MTTLFGIQLVACQPIQSAKTVPLQTSPTTGFLNPGGRQYIVDTSASEIRLLVYREGPLARLGHNHVMTGSVRGEISVSDNLAASGFRLEIPVETFAVDLPLPRSEEGAEFAAEVSDGARQGTRKNMLGEDLLDALQHPVISIESLALNGTRWNPDVIAHIKLRGVTSELKFPATVDEQNGSIVISASFRVLQTELGLQPFSILGGAISVRDAIDVRVHLLARRETE